MASLSTNAQRHPLSFWQLLSAPFRAIGGAMIAGAEANPRLRRIEALQRLSDAELARRGIRREDIVRHVFSDIYFI